MSYLRRDKSNITLDHFPSEDIWTDLDFWHTNTELLQPYNIVSQLQLFLGMENKEVTFGKT